MTVGPWKPIALETYHSRIADVDIRSRVHEDLTVNLDVNFEVSNPDDSIATVSLKGPDGNLVIGQSDMKIGDTQAQAHFKLSSGAYEPWYPVGYGKQPLYTVEITLADAVRTHPKSHHVKPNRDIYHLERSCSRFQSPDDRFPTCSDSARSTN